MIKFIFFCSLIFKAGALFATGIVFSGVQDPEVDPAYAILQDFLFNEHLPLRVASIFGLGLAYANSKRQTVIDQEESVVQSLRKVFFNFLNFLNKFFERLSRMIK